MTSRVFVKLTTSLILLSLAQQSFALDNRTIKATELITDFSLLNSSAAGRNVLQENLAVSIAINNHSSNAQHEQAIYDNTIIALIGSMNNGLLVADALGPTMSNIYFSHNSINQKDYSSTTFSPSFAKLFSQVNALIQIDSSFAKNYLANGSTDGKPANQAEGIHLPDNGIFNIYDEAYDPLDENKNSVGNSRPVQVSPASIDSFTGNDFFGVKTDSATAILPTVKSNASFPSGHSAFGFASTTLFAQLVPERYQDFVLRGSEYGNSRVTLGVHYALDVIGARIMTTYTLAQILNNNPEYLNQDIKGLFGNKINTSDDFQQLMINARNDLKNMLEQGCNASIADCSAKDKATQTDTTVQDRADYLWRMTYGLSAISATDLAPIVPEGAEILIATRFPYLTADQRRDVLATTEIESGHALDNGSGWARINLFDAGGGYGAFNGNVSISMDASQGGFSAYDVWNNNIGGSGYFEKKGSGTLELSGQNSFNGITNVSEGTLIVSGYHGDSAVTVKDGAMLKGNGTIGTLNVESAGILAVPSADNVLTINGDIHLAPNAVYRVDGNHGRIESNGKATIDGSLLKLNLATVSSRTDNTRTYRSIFDQNYTLLTASQGIEGQFTYSPSDYLFIEPTLSYSTNNVTMQLQRNSTAFSDIAQTRNQRNVAQAINQLESDNPLYEQIVLSSSQNDVRAAYQQLDGQLYADITSSLFNDSRHLRDTLNQRLRQKTGEVDFAEVKQNHHGAWVRLLSTWGHTDGDDNAYGYNSKTYGVLLGLDKLTEDNQSVFGVSTGYTRSSINGHGNSSADLNNYHLGLYASHQYHQWIMKIGGIYSWHKIDANRTVQYDLATPVHFSPNYHAQSRQLFTELSYNIDMQQFKLEPFINVAYVNIQTDGFNEGQDAAALTANKQHDDIILSTQGVRFDTKWSITPTFNAMFRNELAWQHQYGNLERDSRLGFNAGTSTFTVNSTSAARDGVILKSHLALKTDDNLEFVLGYNGFWSKNIYDNGLNLGINWAF